MHIANNIIFCLLLGTSLICSACSEWHYSPINQPEYLTDSKGWLVKDCNGQHISKKFDGDVKFWQDNHLPKGTTEFVCRKGKAYLPNQVAVEP